MILLRDGRDEGLEILIVRRGPEASFMPGVWVFAGGAVDPEDHERPLEGLDPEEAAHRNCAVRELAEEASIQADPEALRPWSRWVTPEIVPVRFDTRFYVAPASPGSREPRPDGGEIDAARWISPALALQEHRQGALELPFPTHREIAALSAFADITAVLAEASGRATPPIIPQVQLENGTWSILMPGDPGFSE